MNKLTNPNGRMPRNVWLFGGGMALAGAGLAAVLMMNRPSVEAEEAAALQSAQAPAVSTPAKPARAVETPRVVAKACVSCGVIESVTPVQVKGQANGTGAVVGGVLGGVVGNQMGGGNGRTAMTVLGAIGGGLAGNEVEKRTRGETVYDVRVRMDDGTYRTLQMAQAPVAPGDRVNVEGSNLRRI